MFILKSIYRNKNVNISEIIEITVLNPLSKSSPFLSLSDDGNILLVSVFYKLIPTQPHPTTKSTNNIWLCKYDTISKSWNKKN